MAGVSGGRWKSVLERVHERAAAAWARKRSMGSVRATWSSSYVKGEAGSGSGDSLSGWCQ